MSVSSRVKDDLTGRRFGILTVTGRENRNWVCRCDCGKQSFAQTSALTSGRTKSCGCLRLSILAASRTKHGKSQTPAWNTWRDMVKRCANPNHDAYRHYGGRGIAVCEKWKTFAGFYEDMGDRPDGKSIERINVNGNYEKSNCVWADQDTQVNNKRNTHRVILDGEEMSLSKACKKLGISYARTIDRINVLGWSFEKAIREPKKINGGMYAN